MTATVNIAATLPRVARERPNAPAIYFPHAKTASGRVAYTHYTYAQLDAASDALAAGLGEVGVTRGTRTVLMVRPSLEFFALTFALFKAGAVPVVVDPGIGRSALAQCLGEAAPEAFIGVSEAHAARIVLGWGRASVRHLVTVGRRWFWGGATIDEVRARGAAMRDWTMADTRADELAAILFTSGSTGVPKGVKYTHGNFVAQVEMIRDTYRIEPGEIDLPTFPLFALFDPALGMTTVVPDMDPRAPAKVDARKIMQAIDDFGVTNMFGSPALLNRVARDAGAAGLRAPTLRRVISAGAPVPPETLRRFHALLPDAGEIFTPYGATESLPVASIGSREILGETAAGTADGRGVCVGRPVDGADVAIIAISDEPIAAFADAQRVAPGEVGEITVAGPMVTRAYFNRDASTALAKMLDPSAPNGVRHRMGDVGYFDDTGRLWFCGRKSHRVELTTGQRMFSSLEGIFDAYPGVFRSALVGATPRGRDVTPVLCVEVDPEPPSVDRAALRTALLAAAAARPETAAIQHVLFHPGFPVDIRHNAKIGREALRAWATAELERGR
ncbi:MAG: AMP-binding protein [Myxococcales bacterium]|nr:AMP-binding protein [Myxococcales bacterium]MCB9530883.1 AMP-binding protein [Myxococcales bacterium]MCB9534339.1 AMP-binding protein [Myxococcales bacterium]